MKISRFLIPVTLLFLALAATAYAGDHPQANFGIFGIKHFATVDQYRQNYIGKIVQYFPQFKGGSYYDKTYFLQKGGKFNTDYVISKISGNDKRMTWILTEIGTRNKVKMFVNNQDEIYSYGKYCFCITNTYSIPLFLTEDFDNQKANFIGKLYPTSTDSQIKFEVTDICIQDRSISDYPNVCLVLKNQTDGKVHSFDISNFSYINDLGKVFENPKFKCTYTVVNVLKKLSDNPSHSGDTDQIFYTVQNSIDGTTKDIKAESALKDAFKNDDSRKIFAALSKVEKPSNPSIRYGDTTAVTEKDITKYSYQDNFIDILVFADGSQFNFILKNVSDNTLKVVWNEAVFVDVDGMTSKVMHTGIKYSQKNGDQPASTIIKGAKLEDIAIPTDKVYYSEYLEKWTNYSLYSKAKSNLEGQVIKLMLPIQVMDVVNEYIFEFTLTYHYNHPEYIAD